jgi:hypothetical protein
LADPYKSAGTNVEDEFGDKFYYGEMPFEGSDTVRVVRHGR